MSKSTLQSIDTYSAITQVCYSTPELKQEAEDAVVLARSLNQSIPSTNTSPVRDLFDRQASSLDFLHNRSKN